MDEFNPFELGLVFICFLLLVFSIISYFKLMRSDGEFAGYPSLVRLTFLFSLFRGIHFLLLAFLNYSSHVIGFMPFFHYSELYLLIIDECNNAIMYFIYLHYAMICIHSLNTHPAIVVIHEKIDMRLHFILSFIVVMLYIIVTMTLYCLSILSGNSLVIYNSAVFSVLECYVIIQLLRYIRQLKELLQQTLISVEVKWKQYLREVGIVSFSILALLLRIVFRVLPFFRVLIENYGVALISFYVAATEVGPVTYYLIRTVVVVDNANIYNGYFQQLLTTLQDVVTM